MKSRKSILFVVAAFLMGSCFTGCYYHQERPRYHHHGHQGPPPPGYNRY